MLTARALLAAFDAAYLIALGIWLGTMAFLSFGVAPTVFRALDERSASKFLRALFPRYYSWCALTGALALPASLCGPLTFPEYRGPWVGIQALLIAAATLTMFYCGQSLTPAINAAKDEPGGDRSRFTRLHRLSVRLNGIVMLVLLGLLVSHAARPAARTRGIVEPSPDERALLEMQALRAKAKASAEPRTSSSTATEPRSSATDRSSKGPAR